MFDFIKLFIFYEFAVPITIFKNLGKYIRNYKLIYLDWLEWSKVCLNFAGCKIYSIEGSSPLHIDNNIHGIYLLNHRDIYDFPIDCYLTNGTGMFISRYINMFIFPLQCIYTYLTNTVFYFKRDAVNNKQAFNKSIYDHLNQSVCRNINIYPEGKRHYGTNMIPLKKGAAHIAWDYKMFIQIIITRNKEDVINLRKFTTKKNVNLYCYKSEVIYPDSFNTFDEFNNMINCIWEKSWNIVYGSDENEMNIIPYKM